MIFTKGAIMRKINLIVLVLLAMVLTAADGCDDRVSVLVKDGIQNKEQYQAAGKSVYATVKNTDIDNESKLETAVNVVDSMSDVVNTVAFIPGVSGYAKPIGVGLTVISSIMAFFLRREQKKVKVVTAIAENYSQGLDVARMDGDEKGVVHVEVLEKFLNQETKDHFNATGGTVLE
jgi:predicted PolB exonuclease-like 3'-5' exonuclease